MIEFNLMAISPLDGRYSEKVTELHAYFSEYALIRYRIVVEIEYFISLCNYLDELEGFDKKDFAKLRKIISDFSPAEARRVKDIEKITNHDVKAVEYYLKEKFDQNGWQDYKEFIHFGLTSQDINNTALPMILNDVIFKVYIPNLLNIINLLHNLAIKWSDKPLLAHTHGQPASPTVLGKEIMVFVERIQNQMNMLGKISMQGKFGGATGNFNAHYVAYPLSDWISFADTFLQRLGLERQKYTTQIEHYDNLSATLDNMKRINTILIDLCRDFWTYISMDYFKQKISKNEVGSSAMPHKVNPIDFENAEGNLGLANAMLEFISGKLPISRLQRDLTDSTVSRNIGVPFGYSLIAFNSIVKGFSKLQLNEYKLIEDLEANWVVVSEAIQTILRKNSYPNPYEALKELTRTNKRIGKEEIHQFVDGLNIPEDLKAYMKTITPFNYVGKVPDYSEPDFPDID